MILKGIYTKEGAAKHLKVNSSTLRSWIRRGKKNTAFDVVQTEDGCKLVKINNGKQSDCLEKDTNNQESTST